MVKQQKPGNCGSRSLNQTAVICTHITNCVPTRSVYEPAPRSTNRHNLTDFIPPRVRITLKYKSQSRLVTFTHTNTLKSVYVHIHIHIHMHRFTFHLWYATLTWHRLHCETLLSFFRWFFLFSIIEGGRITNTWVFWRRKMEIFYYMVFGGLAAVVAALELSKSNKDRINTSSAFNSFKNNYLLVYSLMMGR